MGKTTAAKSQNKDTKLLDALKLIAEDIRRFIELSLQNNDLAEADNLLKEWLPSVMKRTVIKCWEKKNCKKKDCPSYSNVDTRCWLIAGTMCGGEVQGEFAKKYKSCTICDVYQEIVFRDPIVEISEHLITLVHSIWTTNEKLKKMAIKDYHTGLYNKNYFNETIPREIEKVRRYGDKLSIIMIDIDNFKYINDTYGHIKGDEVLKDCASILKKSVRSSDFLCRFGGDEFLIATPIKDCTDNEALIMRIKDHLTDWNLKGSGRKLGLSLSIGCSVLDGNRSLEDAIHEADMLMYEDKKNKPHSA